MSAILSRPQYVKDIRKYLLLFIYQSGCKWSHKAVYIGDLDKESNIKYKSKDF